MRVAVTGAGGRLGRALLRVLDEAPFVAEVLAWDLPVHDLDDPASAERLVSAASPDAVIHTAAWTDVDGCARDPALAMRRNGEAAGELARACAARGVTLLAVSTNEVFDGRRDDGRPYRPEDEPNPANPYGLAKLAGETGAREAYGVGPQERAAWAAPLAIVRTSWLFGQPGPDFPLKILAAARAAAAEGRTLELVADEWGCPTYAPDLAAAMAGLLGAAASGEASLGGIHHVVNAGSASRAEWAREVLRLSRTEVATRDVPSAAWPRPSTPPAWGVLEATPLPGGPLRDWRAALRDYLATRPYEKE
jgi:dTDP-4-dehydrorhamnose reductase